MSSEGATDRRTVPSHGPETVPGGLTDSRYNELLSMLHQVRFPAGSQTGEGLGWFTGFLDGKGKGPLMVTKNGGTSGFPSWIGFLQDRTIGAVVLCNTSMPGDLEINKNGSPVDLLGEGILRALSSLG